MLIEQIKRSAILLLLLFAGSTTTSCQTTRAVFIHDGDLIRIGPNVTGSVYVRKNGEWILTKKAKLPEGWYAGAVDMRE